VESNSVSKRRQFALNGGWLARPFRQAHPGKRFPKTGLPERLRHPALGSIASLRYDLSFDRAENGWPHTRERVEDPIPPSNERQKPQPAAIEESRFERECLRRAERELRRWRSSRQFGRRGSPHRNAVPAEPHRIVACRCYGARGAERRSKVNATLPVHAYSIRTPLSWG
jgi:hypothetical protein